MTLLFIRRHEKTWVSVFTNNLMMEEDGGAVGGNNDEYIDYERIIKHRKKNRKYDYT